MGRLLLSASAEHPCRWQQEADRNRCFLGVEYGIAQVEVGRVKQP